MRTWLGVVVLLLASRVVAAPCTPAAEVLEPALLSGPWHSVDPCVRVAGHLWRFELHTDFGKQFVDSKELLAIRVEEMAALAALRELGTPELGVAAFGARSREHGGRVGRIARAPVETARRLPRGVLAFFERRADALLGRARKYGERAADAATGARELYDDPSARPGISRADARDRRSVVGSAGRELERQAKGYVSFGATRRRWAERLGVDPYTSNDALRRELDRLTRAAIVGESAADAAFARLPAAIVASLEVARDVDEYVWKVPPEAVARRNGERLAAIGCSARESRRMLRNGAFTPTLQVALVDALEALEPGDRCDELLDLAAALRGEVEARYLVNALGLLDRWAPDTTHRAIELVGTTPVVRAPAGAASRGQPEIVLPLAVDRLQWTAATRAFFDLPALRVPHKLAIVRGELSPRAAAALTRRGWSIVERAATVNEEAVRVQSTGWHPLALRRGTGRH